MQGKKAILPTWFQARAITHFTLSLCWSTSLPVHRNDLEAAVSEKALAPGHGGCSSMSWDIPAPRYLSPALCSLRAPTAYGGNDERQSCCSDQPAQPSTPESSPWAQQGDPAPAALQGEPGLPQAGPAKSCKGNEGRSKANLLILQTRCCCKPRGSLNRAWETTEKLKAE